MQYCGWHGFALPTEAQWEYCSRAGTRSDYWWGDDTISSTSYCNAARLETAELGNHEFSNQRDAYPFLAPVHASDIRRNPWKLYMPSDVAEWCSDWYDTYGTDDGVITRNPIGPKTSPLGWRVVRGSHWCWPASSFRVTRRRGCAPDKSNVGTGFRVTIPM
jgi:formylglycine-generating enzyme required for sulfatase activity